MCRSAGHVLCGALVCYAAVAALPGGSLAYGGVSGFSDAELREIFEHSPLPPPPPDPTNRVADDPAAARLGHLLFFDKQLSGNGKIACATCHDPKLGFTVDTPLAQGMGKTLRNPPSLWNSAYERWFFRDGRADSLWSQAVSPIEGTEEMGGNRLAVVHLLRSDPALRAAYEAAFGALPIVVQDPRLPASGRPVPSDPQHPDHRAWLSLDPDQQAAINYLFADLTKALAAYQRRLLSRQSPFDVFVEGLRENDERKQQALSASAQRGLRLFIGKGNCGLCHVGPTFSDGEFHNIGVPQRGGGLPTDAGRFAGLRLLREDPFNSRGAYSDAPRGAAAERLKYLAITPQTWGQFKTPTLRNVALTAPYMHAGQFDSLTDVLHYYSTLEGAVSMGHHPETILTPLQFSQQEIQDLEAFLQSLTDTNIDAALLAPIPPPP